jgi:hypothetical protein
VTNQILRYGMQESIWHDQHARSVASSVFKFTKGNWNAKTDKAIDMLDNHQVCMNFLHPSRTRPFLYMPTSACMPLMNMPLMHPGISSQYIWGVL